MPTIDFSSVTVAFDDTVVLEDINLTLTEQRIGIIGQNGGGKSTLTRLINGLGEPSAGTVTVDQMDVAKQGKKVREKVGFVFSDAENQIVMPNVRDDVAFSLRRFKLPKHERLARVDAALERFGLAEFAERRIRSPADKSSSSRWQRSWSSTRFSSSLMSPLPCWICATAIGSKENSRDWNSN